MWSSLIAMVVYSLVLASPPEKSELIPLSKSLVSSGYELIVSDHNVDVYRNEDRPSIVLAAEGNFKHSPDKVLALLLDYKKHPDLVENVEVSRVLESGPDWALVYERLSLPVISDRDYVMLVKWGIEGETTWMVFDAVKDRGPEATDEAVRITLYHGSWQLRALPEGKGTSARFQVSVDFSGSVPMWMVSSGAADALPDLFRTYRKALSKGL